MIVGRTREGGPAGHVGRYLARDGSHGERVDVDLDGPHVVLVVGKRGTGKSYTLGVLAEELARADGVAPVVADRMGALGSLTAAADGERVPARRIEPRVPADALDPRAWCAMLGLDPTAGAGTLVWRAAETAGSLEGMRAFVADAGAATETRRAAANHLRLAAAWDAFGPGEFGNPTGGAATVLDLAGRDRAPANAVVAAVASRLYDERVRGRAARLPWLLVDEAHAFFEGAAAPTLRRLLTRGRGPGVTLVAATQRPSALPEVAVSQADLLVVHRLTSGADREALTAARPTYVTGSLTDRMPAESGEALVIDDATESVHAIRVRKRDTPHDGGSPRVSDGPG